MRIFLFSLFLLVTSTNIGDAKLTYPGCRGKQEKDSCFLSTQEGLIQGICVKDKDSKKLVCKKTDPFIKNVCKSNADCGGENQFGGVCIIPPGQTEGSCMMYSRRNIPDFIINSLFPTRTPNRFIETLFTEKPSIPLPCIVIDRTEDPKTDLPRTGGKICAGPMYKCDGDKRSSKEFSYEKCKNRCPWIPGPFGGGRIDNSWGCLDQCKTALNQALDKGVCTLLNPGWEKC